MRTGPSKAEAPTGPSCSQEPRPLTPSPQTTDFQELQRRVSWFATDFCQFEAAKAEGPCCPLCRPSSPAPHTGPACCRDLSTQGLT